MKLQTASALPGLFDAAPPHVVLGWAGFNATRFIREKEGIEFVFRQPRRSSRGRLEAELCNVVAELRGEVDWEAG